MTTPTTRAPRRGYIDTRWGQLHYLAQDAADRHRGDAPRPPLVCLHATAYSGRSFGPLLPRLAQHRRVFAPDTPGYGASDGPPTGPPPFTAYAEVIGEALRVLGAGRPVDLFGYHTGALLATEIAAQSPALVRRLVLIGVPFFEGEAHARWRAKLVHPAPAGERLADFQPRWDFFVTHRLPGVPLARGIAHFVDELRAHPHEAWAHEALFDYPAAERLPLVRQPVLVINPASPLAAASTDAAARLPDARVVSLPELSHSIFDLGTPLLATTMEAFLDADLP